MIIILNSIQKHLTLFRLITEIHCDPPHKPSAYLFIYFKGKLCKNRKTMLSTCTFWKSLIYLGIGQNCVFQLIFWNLEYRVNRPTSLAMVIQGFHWWCDIQNSMHSILTFYHQTWWLYREDRNRWVHLLEPSQKDLEEGKLYQCWSLISDFKMPQSAILLWKMALWKQHWGGSIFIIIQG